MFFQLEEDALKTRGAPMAPDGRAPDATALFYSTTGTTTGRYDKGLNLANHLDFEARRASFRRVAYPVERTQEEIRKRGLPDALAERLARGV